MSRPLYLIDGSGYIFRAYYAIRPLSTRAGVPTNAVVGFVRMLAKLIKDHHPDHVGIAFDTREPTFRHEMYTEYKANRDAPPEDLAPQFALIHELVESMDIPLLKVPGFEADDILATLATQAVARGQDVVVVTGDKDLMQLVSPHVRIYDPMKDKMIDREQVVERFGVPPEQVVDILALCGDSSDNIPGVPKVGPKGATKLVTEFGDVEAIIAGLSAKPDRKAAEQSVLDHAADARLSKILATLRHDVPVPIDLEKLAYTQPVEAKLGAFLQKIEATALLREFGFNPASAAAQNPASGTATVAKQEAPPPPSTQDTETPAQEESRPMLAGTTAVLDRKSYQTVYSPDALRAFLAGTSASGVLAVDLETTSLEPTRAAIVGVALATGPGVAAYVPVGHRYLGAPAQMPWDSVAEILRPYLLNPALKKCGQNIKYDMQCLMAHGLEMAGPLDDSMIGAYVLDATRASYGLDALSREVLGHETLKFSEVTGKDHAFESVDVATATAYAGEDADVALRLCATLGPKLKAAHLDTLYQTLEMPLVPVLASMEFVGIRVDTERLAVLGKEFSERMVVLEKQAHALIGAPINLASPKQLAEVFFNKLGYPVVKRTKTGPSTDQDVLETLAKTYELPRVILEHRMLAKLRSTYVDALQKIRNPKTGRIHTNYHQTGTATGRLSSNDPNLQNIPIRSDDGKRIRGAFIAQDGWQLLSADYSQIELRVMAHLSGDEAFVAAFNRGEDIHRRTAMEILTQGAEPDAEARRRAKAINFGILYGLSEFGLSKQLEIPRAEASQYISRYFGRYSKIRHFLDHTIETAKTTGYVSTMAGRRRYLPELHSKNGNVRQGAERIAMNTPIQGSAADIIKLAMLRVHAELRKRGMRTRLLLQVHDELVAEVPNDELAAAQEVIRTAMETAYPLGKPLAVPLSVSIGVGHDWASAH